MAVTEQSPDKDKKRVTKKNQTIRERAAKAQSAQPRRIRSAATGKLAGPAKRARHIGRKEYHLPLPDNKVGRILSKRVRLFPKFVREAWAEIRLVTWPSPRDTLRLTMAVFIFSVIFAVIVGLLDYGLDKLFKEVLLDVK